MPSDQASAPAEGNSRIRVGLKDLFLGFLKIGLLGFGGVAPQARHVIVEDRAWLSEKEYASVLGIGQLLPGANTINAAVMIGDKFRGLPGAVAAVTGMMAMPIVVLIGLALLYEHFSQWAPVKAALSGSAAAAAGLIIGVAIKMARRIEPSKVAVVFGLLAFGAVALLHFSLVPVVLVFVPVSIGAAFLRRRA
jgi:chromate transporter